jgi:hypothetical protein
VVGPSAHRSPKVDSCRRAQPANRRFPSRSDLKLDPPLGDKVLPPSDIGGLPCMQSSST